MRGMGMGMGRNMQVPGGRRQSGAAGGRNSGGGSIPMGGMGPMGRTGGIGTGNRGGVLQEKAALFSQMLIAAMQKTSLVQVAIAGKLTLFQPPAVDESAIAGNDPSGATATDPATAVPPTGDAASANGVGTNPDAKTTEEPAVPGTSPENIPANGTPAGTPSTNATPLPNTNEKAAPTPETTPASEAAKPATTQPEQKQPE